MKFLIQKAVTSISVVSEEKPWDSLYENPLYFCQDRGLNWDPLEQTLAYVYSAQILIIVRYGQHHQWLYRCFAVIHVYIELSGIDTTICAETEMLDGSGAFQSPFSTELGTYPPNAECQYVITVESGMVG